MDISHIGWMDNIILPGLLADLVVVELRDGALLRQTNLAFFNNELGLFAFFPNFCVISISIPIGIFSR